MLLAFLYSHVRTRVHDERGAALVEYVFLISFIAIACLLAVTFLGVAADTRLDFIVDELRWVGP